MRNKDKRTTLLARSTRLEHELDSLRLHTVLTRATLAAIALVGDVPPASKR